MMRFLRSALVIARRDFAATVLSKTFIFFLLGPLFPLLLGGMFGSIGARVATQTQQPTVAVIMSQAEYEALHRAREALVRATGEGHVVKIVGYPRGADDAELVQRLLTSEQRPARAVLTGWFGAPRLIGNIKPGDQISQQVEYLLDRAIMPGGGLRAPSLDIRTTSQTPAHVTRDRALTAQLGQMALFFLTILLSGMLLSQLVEEKSNKIIEVIAAAVPIDALFVGKLFAMLAASVIGIIVWIGAGAVLIDLIKQGGVATLPPPATGWPTFLGLGVAYFAMNYLLLGAVFLTIGAQAATVREVQTMSMPVTFLQVLVFGFAATAIGAPSSGEALLAALFPLSSPMAMIARAAERPDLWPHALALGWQLLWVVIILRLGARLFRKTVLKSGPRGKSWWRLRRPSVQ
ncbi:ABC transporter permease [Sphingomonas lutea]|uniref:ABC transporter permease n=1 Tax=Sphingomonas lutea TaxID=1045317 RepID=A0A7G9SIX1_9SPHN|nr:ABC transporter permease [Sphingomonas lutea]QNN67796.1 ABC transporter permease [Sphingomonas lutea]